MNGKQKRYLRAQIATQPAILHIGKGGLTPNLLIQIDDALTARELIKIKMLANSDLQLAQAAETIAMQLQAELVQLIGSNIVLYRHSNQRQIHLLPMTVRSPVEPRERTSRRRIEKILPKRGTKGKSKTSNGNENMEHGQAKPKPKR